MNPGEVFSLLRSIKGAAGRPVVDWRHTLEKGLHDSDGVIHVYSYEEQGTVAMRFTTTVLEKPARLHLTLDAIGWLPRSGGRGICLKRQFEENQDIREYGEDPRRLRIGNGGT
ncbi:MAG: hypothetical protein P4K98_10845 [Bryobacteraceae bacterium]|nr:hypothetical protein [Bryobacteraceae bacterium]